MAAGLLNVRKTVDTLTPALSDLQRRQLPFATAVSLTQTAKGTRQDLTDAIAQAFDRPTRYTLGAVASLSASKTRLTSAVLIKDDSAKGTPPLKFLAAEVQGGERRAKRFERALQARGLLPAGWIAVPGNDTKLDASGNVSGALIVSILSDLRAFAEVGYIANRVTKREARLSGGARKVRRAGKYFVVQPGKRGQPGIYRKTGGGIELVFIFARHATYAPRYDFFKLAEASARKRFPVEFNKALAAALASAR
jgi:hypothetical protein